MVSQKVKNACHFERQREIFLLNHWVLLRFLPMVEMTLWQSGLFAKLSFFVQGTHHDDESLKTAPLD
jgi:hypothetical protein